jgi:hypothetical protein
MCCSFLHISRAIALYLRPPSHSLLPREQAERGMGVGEGVSALGGMGKAGSARVVPDCGVCMVCVLGYGDLL